MCIVGMVDVLSRVTPSLMKEVQEEDIDISKTYMLCQILARNRCLHKLEKLNQDLCEGISISLTD